MPVYTIYLSSNNGNISSFNLSSNQEIIPIDFSKAKGAYKSWEIDWDKIFKGDNYKYKKCRVKSNLQSKGVSYTTAFNDGAGYLTIDIPSIYNATTTYNGIPLGLTQFYNVTTATDGTYRYCFLNNKLDDNDRGNNINSPTGRSIVNVTLNQGDRLESLSLPAPYTYQFQLILSFEFYN